MTVYHHEPGHTIHHGDALEIGPTLQGAALILADPPYYRVVDDDWDDQWGADVEKFIEWTGQALDAIKPALIDRGSLIWFCSPHYAAPIEMEIRKRFAVLNHIVWDRPSSRLKNADKKAMRRFFPTSERMIFAEQLTHHGEQAWQRHPQQVGHKVAAQAFAPIREHLNNLRNQAGLSLKQIDQHLGTAGMAGHYFSPSQWVLPTREAWTKIAELMRRHGVNPPEYDELRHEYDELRHEYDELRHEYDELRRSFNTDTHRPLHLYGDVWQFPTVPAAHRTANHPTQKPLPLIRYIIETTTRPGDLIIDPFGGSGTTARAAKDLGRQSITIEIDEQYCEAGKQRLAQQALPL